MTRYVGISCGEKKGGGLAEISRLQGMSSCGQSRFECTTQRSASSLCAINSSTGIIVFLGLLVMSGAVSTLRSPWWLGAAKILPLGNSRRPHSGQ